MYIMKTQNTRTLNKQLQVGTHPRTYFFNTFLQLFRNYKNAFYKRIFRLRKLTRKVQTNKRPTLHSLSTQTKS